MNSLKCFTRSTKQPELTHRPKQVFISSPIQVVGENGATTRKGAGRKSIGKYTPEKKGEIVKNMDAMPEAPACDLTVTASSSREKKIDIRAVSQKFRAEVWIIQMPA